MDNITIIANAIALAASCIMVGIGLIRDKRRLLLTQCAQFGLMGLSNLLLGGMSGCISNFISIARNLCCVKREMSLVLKLGFSAVQVALTLLVSDGGALEVLPVLAAVVYTFCLDTKSPVFLKCVMAGTQSMWVVYDFAMRNYVAFTFDVFTICSVLISIAMLRGLIKPRGSKVRAV